MSVNSESRPARRRSQRLALRGASLGSRAAPAGVHRQQALSLAHVADRLCCMLVDLTTSALQGGHGRLFGMGQRTAHQGRPVLLPALLAARRALGAAPARSRTALAQRLGGSEAAAVTGVAVPTAAPASPLVPMTGRNDASSAPTTLWNRPTVIAGRNRITRSKMSCACRRCSSSSC